jgi:hypothetical protein
MEMDKLAVFFAGSILVTLGMIVIASGVILVNNLIYKYWKPVTWFKYDYKTVYFDPKTGEQFHKPEEPMLETKDKK